MIKLRTNFFHTLPVKSLYSLLCHHTSVLKINKYVTRIVLELHLKSKTSFIAFHVLVVAFLYNTAIACSLLSHGRKDDDIISCSFICKLDMWKMHKDRGVQMLTFLSVIFFFFFFFSFLFFFFFFAISIITLCVSNSSYIVGLAGICMASDWLQRWLLDFQKWVAQLVVLFQKGGMAAST